MVLLCGDLAKYQKLPALTAEVCIYLRVYKKLIGFDLEFLYSLNPISNFS